MSRKRQLKDTWLRSYGDYIVRQESPPIFHFWVAAQMITAALKRNVFVDRGSYRLYPNQYVFLISKSGTCKKSSAIDIGMDLIHKIDSISIVHGRMSVEGLIAYMQKASRTPSGKIVADGSVLVHADELAYLFGKASYITDLITFFTAAYSSRTKLDFLTRNKGMLTVRNPCPSIISATTPEQMSEIFPSITLVSGFLARVIMVFSEPGPRVPNPLLNVDMRDMLIHDLGCISELEGAFTLADDAEEFFNPWYENIKVPDDPNIASFIERKHDHVLKLALILSVSESSEKIITKKHLIDAISLVTEIERNSYKALEYIGATAQSAVGDLILGYLRSVYPNAMNKSVLLRRIYRKLTGGAQELNTIMNDLVEQDRVEIMPSGGAIWYRFKRKVRAKKEDEGDEGRSADEELFG